MTPKPLTRRKINTFRYLTLAPDGVEFEVDWQSMEPGMSVFIPCVDHQQALNELNYVCERMNWTFEYAIRVENHKMGLRFWRLS